jgi:O-antigen biosynthesis protein
VTFWQAFFRTLRWRPRQALAGLYWHVTRRKVRARNRLRVGAAQAPDAYDVWIQTIEDNPALGSRVPSIVEGWHCRPTFSILLHAPPDVSSDKIERTIASVKEQFYPGWELLITAAHADEVGPDGFCDARFSVLAAQTRNSAQELDAAIAAATGDFLVPLHAGQLLSPGALFRFAEVLQGTKRPSIIYGDQDQIDMRGRRARPWFKPQWDEEMFLAQDYMSDACAVDTDLVRCVSPIAEPSGEAVIYALLLAASRAAPGPIVHVPYVLCHVGAGLKRSNQAARVAAVERHVQPLGATCMPGPFDTVKVEWPLPDDRPGVSIIIPTRDKVELLRACVDSVLNATSYSDFELIIVDNGSTEGDTLAYLSQIGTHPRVRLLSYDRPYNYSEINNFAAGHASAPYLCLLNNDTEVIAPDWLTEMMRYAVRREVGAVGAKLLYDDGSVQHAGVIIGTCEAAGHPHRFERSDELGYFAQQHITHVVSAVTAACLVVEKSKYEAVGGLDAASLAVAYNDVDLCMKLEQAGWHNIYVPHAVLLHHESKSRGLDSSPENRDRYMRELAVLQERWGTRTYDDPRHNVNLDRNSETFILQL